MAVNATTYTYRDDFNPAEIPGNATAVGVYDHPVNTLIADGFAHLTSCTTMLFHRTNISAIEPRAWFGLDRLEYLQLFGNELTVLTAGMFSYLSSLQQLILFENKITLIDHDVFTNLSSLIGLTLNNNNIRILHEDTFVHLIKLESLFLNENEIIFIEDGAFKGLHSLSLLSLAGNNLNNSVFTFPSVFTDVSDTLLKLYFFNNDIDKIYNDMFVEFTSLEDFKIGSMYIEANGFRGLNSLNSLSLHQVKLDENRTSVDLRTLMELEFINADIKSLTKSMFAGTPSLRQLIIYNCGVITVQSGAFNALNDIETIGLSYNRITVVAADAFSGLQLLKHLWLASNNISTIEPGTFQGLSSLEFLWLSDNLLTTLEWNVFDTNCGVRSSQFARPLFLYVAPNPFICDRRMEWMTEGEEQGWLSLFYFTPNCMNFPNRTWRNISLPDFDGQK